MHQNENQHATVAEAAQAMTGGAFAADKIEPAPTWWHFRVFGVRLYCYNFAWRRRALFSHDLHHVVTGYPHTMRGECLVATWEFSAGRFPNIYANLFCLPLVALGALLAPVQTLKAFIAGQTSASLFERELGAEVLTWPVQQLKALTKSKRKSRPYEIQILKFFGLVLCSIALTLGVPALVAVAILR